MTASGLLLAACLAIPASSDRVTAGDLAPASAAFASLDPGAPIGWAPAPGVQRVFRTAELRRIAARLGATGAPDADVCIERKVAAPDTARILAILQAAFPEGRVELLDFSRAPVPDGEIMFPAAGLRRGPGALYWNGYVRYATGRKFAIWAKVRLRADQPVVVATADLAARRGIDPSQLRLETRGDFIPGVVTSMDEAIGRWPRRPIRAGTPIASTWIEPAPEVVRGDAIKVQVWSGGAHLELDARAENSARRGERVAVRNPENYKRFFARVESKGLVTAGTPHANLPDQQKP